MTNVSLPVVRTVAPLVSKDKGSIGNRLDCAGQQLKNDVVTLAETGATVGGAALATTGIAKSNKVASFFGKVYDRCTKLCGMVFGKRAKNIANKLNNKLYSISDKLLNSLDKTVSVATKGVSGFLKNRISAFQIVNKIKGFGIVSAITLPLLAYIQHKGSYKAGQIDQKYTDRAKTQTLAK